MRRPNEVLAKQLALAGWRPPQLVAAVNALLGESYLSRSTVSEWLHAGRVPREPLPSIVAQLLSEACERHIAVHDLWPRAPLACGWMVRADSGLAEITGSASPAVALAKDWIRHANRNQGCDRRIFSPIVPPRETPRNDDLPAEAPGTGHWGDIARSVVAQLASLPLGPVAMRFAHRQMLTHAETLIDRPQDEGITTALAAITTAAEELARTAGAIGLAQRYCASSSIFRDSLASPPKSPATQ